MNDLTPIADLLDDNERASTEKAREIVLGALATGTRTPELNDALFAVARSLYETAESHEEGVEALGFALTRCGPKAAAELLADFDGADAVQRAHLVLMAESSEWGFSVLHAALPQGAPVRQRLGKELRAVTRR